MAYRQPIYHVNRPIARKLGGGTSIGRRVGMNWHTGLGQYPLPIGMLDALRDVPESRYGQVKMVVWGAANFSDPNYPPDALGGTTVLVMIDKQNALDWLTGQRYLRNPAAEPGWIGSTGGDERTALFVYDMSGYAYREIWAVTFEEI